MSEKGLYFNASGKITEKVKDEDIPKPLFSDNNNYLDTYNYAVSIMKKNIIHPNPKSGFISSMIKTAFNNNIFLWDTSFITIYSHMFGSTIPGIESLDNFYIKQFKNGEICREIDETTGEDFSMWKNKFNKTLYSYYHYSYKFRSANKNLKILYENTYKPMLGRDVTEIPNLTLDAINNPMLALAEWKNYEYSGDVERLFFVIRPLYEYIMVYYRLLRHKSNLYITDWASMDNSPRNKFLGLAVDTSSQVVLNAKIIKRMNEIVDEKNKKKILKKHEINLLNNIIEKTSDAINKYMWDPETNFYYDVDFEFNKSNIKTAACFWTIISGVADKFKLDRLIEHITNKNEFWRLHKIPSLSADEEGYESLGGYWKGGVWSPIEFMITEGLKMQNQYDLAKTIAINHVDIVSKVFEKTGTILEYYPPDKISAGENDKFDFVGWSGLGPIRFLIEYYLGIEAKGYEDKIIWNINQDLKYSGCYDFQYKGAKVDLLARKTSHGYKIKVKSPIDLKLEIILDDKIEFNIKKNEIFEGLI